MSPPLLPLALPSTLWYSQSDHLSANDVQKLDTFVAQNILWVRIVYTETSVLCAKQDVTMGIILPKILETLGGFSGIEILVVVLMRVIENFGEIKTFKIIQTKLL